MTRLIDHIAWRLYLAAPLGWEGRWFWRWVGNRVADAMIKRDFQP